MDCLLTIAAFHEFLNVEDAAKDALQHLQCVSSQFSTKIKIDNRVVSVRWEGNEIEEQVERRTIAVVEIVGVKQELFDVKQMNR